MPVPDTAASAAELQALTSKPVLYVANVDEGVEGSRGRLRAGEEERRRRSRDRSPDRVRARGDGPRRGRMRHELRLPAAGLERLIGAAYELLGLITFFTAHEGSEGRAQPAARRDGMGRGRQGALRHPVGVRPRGGGPVGPARRGGQLRRSSRASAASHRRARVRRPGRGRDHDPKLAWRTFPRPGPSRRTSVTSWKWIGIAPPPLPRSRSTSDAGPFACPFAVITSSSYCPGSGRADSYTVTSTHDGSPS